MRKKILLTGATGSMGLATLKELLKEEMFYTVAFVRDTEQDREIIKPYINLPRVRIHYGDLTEYDSVKESMSGIDIILHCAAYISPAADDHPHLAMKINYGSTINLVRAIKEQDNWMNIRFVSIGTVAETGDRMPPIHWGRVGDPIKPSYHDYYAVSKIAAERAVIESGLKYWVSLRQTGILSEKMAKISDPIMFHNCLDNVLEYVTDHDSGVLMKNCCYDLPDEFWGHIYNIGGGQGCRMSCFEMFEDMFGPLGFTNLENVLDSKWFAIRNFHGQYYLDSDKLEKFLGFRSQDKEFFYNIYLKNMGITVPLAKMINKLPGGEKLMGTIIKSNFKKHLYKDRGPLNWIENNKDEYIQPFFISKEKWNQIPHISEMTHFSDWDQVWHIDHGYDENMPEEELDIPDLRGAAEFRGGKLVSKDMIKGDWTTKLQWVCAFGHTFEASPRLVLEGGHWCPQCERESWNYQEMAKVNPFFAQVWYPLHDEDEPILKVKKIVDEREIEDIM